MTISRSSVKSSRSSSESNTICNPNSAVATPNSPEFPKQETCVNTNDIQDDGVEENDPEDDLERPVSGWPKVALLMAQTPDFASFSRFRDLNIKSLLYYQSELTSIRKSLHKQEWKDYRLGAEDEKHEYCNRADYLVNSKESGGEPSKQWALVLKMRSVLKEYSEFCHVKYPDTFQLNSQMRHFSNSLKSQLCQSQIIVTSKPSEHG